MDPAASLAPDEPLSFSCPRCRAEAAEHWYGPCRSCRDALRATVAGTAHAVDSTYEPKLNVTPNAVALKE